MLKRYMLSDTFENAVAIGKQAALVGVPCAFALTAGVPLLLCADFLTHENDRMKELGEPGTEFMCAAAAVTAGVFYLSEAAIASVAYEGGAFKYYADLRALDH